MFHRIQPSPAMRDDRGEGKERPSGGRPCVYGMHALSRAEAGRLWQKANDLGCLGVKAALEKAFPELTEN